GSRQELAGRRRAVFDLGDDAHSGLAQRGDESLAVRRARARRLERRVLPARQALARGREDLIEDAGAHRGAPALRASKRWRAVPRSTASRARTYPSTGLSVLPSTVSAIAAFKRTASRRGPGSPSKRRSSIAALPAASDPASSSIVTGF